MHSNEIKYQIFISSTYEDLKAERNSVIETILKHYQFPIGMELFNADNEGQWKVIRKTIDTSDLYILIIGHRYGSISKGKRQISYTEKEFNYARNHASMPILAFIIDSHQPVDPSVVDKHNSDKLTAFIKKVENSDITYDRYTTADDLAKKVSFALSKMLLKFKDEDEFANFGWIKKSTINPTSLTVAETSILNNSSAINNFLEETANTFMIINEDVERHYFDGKGNCRIERKRMQICQNDVTHTFMKYKSDKEGISKVIEITDNTDFKVSKPLPYIICYQNETILNFCIFFGRILKNGEKITFDTTVYIANFLSDLIETGTGYINYKGLNNTKFKKRDDYFTFPKMKKFDNLTLNLVQIFPGKILNKAYHPTINGSKKTFHVDYGMINDNFDIRLEFKLN